MKETILIVEDEPAISKAVHDYLEDEGFDPLVAGSGEAALNQDLERISLALLDIRLPGIDGYQLLTQIRQQGYSFPVIFLSARDDVTDRILGLELGADDYLVKPFSFRELHSRIRAQLRRAYGNLSKEQDQKSRLHIGSLTIDKKGMRVYKDQKDVYLTPIEYRMFLLFVEYPSQVLNRDQIIEHVWGNTWSIDDPKSVNVHLRHLREKIEDDPADPKLILTVRGYGYRFEMPED